MARKPPANHRMIEPQPNPEALPPPSDLGNTGASLWRKVAGEYQFDDPGSIETLHQACLALDRAERCAVAINRDGEVMKGKTGPRDHPLLRHEAAARSFVVRTLARLGLDLEPVRSGPGRPPGR